MNKSSLILRTVVWVLACSRAIAQPANDACGQNQASYTLPGMGGTINGTFQGANVDGGSSSCGANGPDVYFYFTPAVAGTYSFSTCSSSSGINTVLSIHTGCPATQANYVGGSTLTACNDDYSLCGNRSQFDSPLLAAGVPITIRVAKIGGGVNTFTLTVSRLVDNNACGQNQAAYTIPGAGGSVVGSLTLATLDSTQAIVCGGGDADVFYYFTPTTATTHRFSTCTSVMSTNTQVSIHTGCPVSLTNYYGGSATGACGGAVFSCSQGAGFDSGTLAAGVPLVIRVSRSGNNNSDFTLTVTPNPTGACCDDINGSCTTAYQLDCVSGRTFAGAAVVCATGVCPQAGACCDNYASGACTSRTVNGCDSSHTFLGVATICTPNPCPQPRACCNLSGGSCAAVAPAGCSSPNVARPEGSSCFPNPCQGACCNATGTCIVLPVVSCAATTRYMGAGTTCNTINICPAAGGGFTLVWSTTDGGGTGPAAPIGGTPPVGAPFQAWGTIGQPDAAATALSAGGFTMRGGFWSTTLGTPCRADFDGVSGVTVADIFAFLAAWFAASPSADFNGVGGVTVADIFAFLSAWFAGCP